MIGLLFTNLYSMYGFIILYNDIKYDAKFVILMIFVVIVAVLRFKIEIEKARDEAPDLIEKEIIECIVSDEKLTVYKKAHRNYGVLVELEPDAKLTIEFSNIYNGFNRAILQNKQIGYVLKSAKLKRVDTNKKELKDY